MERAKQPAQCVVRQQGALQQSVVALVHTAAPLVITCVPHTNVTRANRYGMLQVRAR